MRTDLLSLYTTSYRNSPGSNYGNGHTSLKRMLSQANIEAAKKANGIEANNRYAMPSSSVISNSFSYSEQLKAQREKSRDAALEKKKVKYQFKDISSQIIRSKTSQAARRAVSSARRELLRLKQQRKDVGSDSEELEAAITHAKAMERIAKKKVKHLEEEEMLKAAGGIFAEIEEKEEKEASCDTEESNGSSADVDENVDYVEEALPELVDSLTFEYPDTTETISPEFVDDIEALTSELMDDMEEGMRDMLEEMGFGELADSLTAAKGEIDTGDLKMMKIKHRCKEMKEIVKADAEYLKAVFDHLEKVKTGFQDSMAPSMGSIPNDVAAPAQAPVIDISL